MADLTYTEIIDTVHAYYADMQDDWADHQGYLFRKKWSEEYYQKIRRICEEVDQRGGQLVQKTCVECGGIYTAYEAEQCVYCDSCSDSLAEKYGVHS